MVKRAEPLQAESPLQVMTCPPPSGKSALDPKQAFSPLHARSPDDCIAVTRQALSPSQLTLVTLARDVKLQLHVPKQHASVWHPLSSTTTSTNWMSVPLHDADSGEEPPSC